MNTTGIYSFEKVNKRILDGTWETFIPPVTGKTLWSWGRNNYGELGIGNTTQQNSPIQVGTDINWDDALGVGHLHTLVKKTNGTLWSWGGVPNIQLSPVQIVDTNWYSVSRTIHEFSLAMKLA